MSEHELDAVECQLMGMSLEKAQQIIEGASITQRRMIKRQDADMGLELPSPASQVPDFVLKRTRVVTIRETQVE